MAFTPARFSSLPGVLVSAETPLFPSPSWPLKLRPQAHTVPSSLSARVWPPPPRRRKGRGRTSRPPRRLLGLRLELEDRLPEFEPLLFGEALVGEPLLESLEPIGYTGLGHGASPSWSGPPGSGNSRGGLFVRLRGSSQVCIDLSRDFGYIPYK